MDRGRFALRPASGNGPDDVDRVLALALLHVAMLFSDAYRRWLRWTGLIVSIPMIVLGVIQIFNARSITLTLIFSMLMMLTTL